MFVPVLFFWNEDTSNFCFTLNIFTYLDSYKVVFFFVCLLLLASRWVGREKRFQSGPIIRDKRLQFVKVFYIHSRRREEEEDDKCRKYTSKITPSFRCGSVFAFQMVLDWNHGRTHGALIKWWRRLMPTRSMRMNWPIWTFDAKGGAKVGEAAVATVSAPSIDRTTRIHQVSERQVSRSFRVCVVICYSN